VGLGSLIREEKERRGLGWGGTSGLAGKVVGLGLGQIWDRPDEPDGHSSALKFGMGSEGIQGQGERLQALTSIEGAGCGDMNCNPSYLRGGGRRIQARQKRGRPHLKSKAKKGLGVWLKWWNAWQGWGPELKSNFSSAIYL
jgi:hypothetical protein